MTIDGIKYLKYYIRIDQIFLFIDLMNENEIKFINEKELHTNINSNVFYIKQTDLQKVDNLCINNNIDLSDDYSNVLDDRYYNFDLPKYIQPFLNLIVFFLIILFLLLLGGII